MTDTFEDGYKRGAEDGFKDGIALAKDYLTGIEAQMEGVAGPEIKQLIQIIREGIESLVVAARGAVPEAEDLNASNDE
jgi:hypothetical protein